MVLLRNRHKQMMIFLAVVAGFYVFLPFMLQEKEPLAQILQIPTVTDKTKVPKILWTFWDSTVLPAPFPRDCIKTWKTFNTGYTINIIDTKNLNYLGLSLPHNFYTVSKPSFRSDWLRLAVLYKYGGIWMDASFIVTASLDWVIDLVEKEQSSSFLFYLEDFTDPGVGFPYYESWFISSRPDTELLKAWWAEFNICFERFDMSDNYLSFLLQTYGKQQYDKLIQRQDNPSYLKIHIALQKVLQIDGQTKPATLVAHDSNHGPYYILSKAKFKLWKYAELLYAEPWSEKLPPLIKIRSCDREILQFYLKIPRYDFIGLRWEIEHYRRELHPGSIWAKTIGLVSSGEFI